MPTKAELLDEAYRRDLLPPDKKAAYEEARKRGLVGQATAQPAEPYDPRASREASLDKRMELRQVENLKRKAERANNTTTAEDAFVGQAAQWGTQGLWDGIRASYDVAGEEGGLMKSTRDMVPVFGALPYASDKVRAGLVGDQARKDDLEAREDVYEKQRGVAMQEHPLAALAGSVTGGLGSGGLGYKAVSGGVRMLPGVNALAQAIGGLGRTASYTGRLGTSGTGFYADAQLQGMTAGAGDEAALAAAAGEPQTDLSLADRANVGQQYANFGPDVPTPFGDVRVPVSAALPVVGSAAMRGTNTVRKGYATPDAIAATQANVHGRAPTRGAVPKSITETTRDLDGQVVPGDVRGIMGIENALRDALKGVQVNGKSRTASEINTRIADGFKSIRQQLPLLDDTTLNFARLIEREFSNESPQVTDTIRRFLLKVGMDTPEGGAVVQNATNRIRGQQNDVLEQEANSQFGFQPKADAKQTLKNNKKLIWEQGYRQALDQPLGAAGQDEALNSILSRKSLLDDAARAEGVSVDDYVLRNPLKALHEVRSELGDRARTASSSGKPDYDLEDEIKAMAGILDANVPGYKELRTMYAKEATAYDRLGTTRGAEAGPKGELGYEPGFGERLFGGTPATPGAASRAEGRATAVDVFAGMDPQSKKAAALSVRDVILDDLGKARAAGVEERYATAAKFNALRTQGALEAMEDVFGAEGKAVADRVRQFVDANQFARDIDPNFNSATMNKAQAMREGAVPFSNSIGRKLGTGVGGDGDALLGDAALLMSGNAPILGMMRVGRKVPGLFQPRKSTEIKVAKTLLKQSERGGQVPSRRMPPPPINALSAADLPGGPVSSAGPSALRSDAGNALAGGVVGGAMPADNNQDRARNIMIGAGGAGLAGRVGPRSANRGVRGQSFVGINSKDPAVIQRLTRAKEMEKAGASREEIWSETMSMKGADGKWRAEISDKASTYIPDTPAKTLGDMQRHDELYRSYPEMANAPANRINDVNPVTGERALEGSYDKGVYSVHDELGKTSGRKTTLHEGQHGIQDIEGFARGGNPSEHYPEEILQKIEDLRMLEDDLVRKSWTTDPEKKAIYMQKRSDVEQEISALRRQAGQERLDWYKRLSGEVEARGVEARRDLSMDQRRNRPAWMDEDVAREDQIVRFGGGASESRPPKIKSDIPLGTPPKGKAKLPKSLNEMMAEPVPMQGIAKATGHSSTIGKANKSAAENMMREGKTAAEVHKKTGLVPLEINGKRILLSVEGGADSADEVIAGFYAARALPRNQQEKWVQELVDEFDPLVLDKPLKPKGPVRGAGFVGKPNLPMDQASRMARAKADGFDTDTVLYHGTATDVSSFDPRKAGGVTKARSAKLGTWLTSSQKTAEGYADFASGKPVQDLIDASYAAERAGQWDKANALMAKAEALESAGGSGQNIMPLYVKGKIKSIDMDGVKYDPDDVNLSEIVRDAKREGFDGIRLKNFSDEAGYGNYNPTDHVVIFDPKNIRSKFAKFDPEKRSSKNLLAGVPLIGGAGAVAANEGNALALPPRDEKTGQFMKEAR